MPDSVLKALSLFILTALHSREYPIIHFIGGHGMYSYKVVELGLQNLDSEYYPPAAFLCSRILCLNGCAEDPKMHMFNLCMEYLKIRQYNNFLCCSFIYIFFGAMLQCYFGFCRTMK